MRGRARLVVPPLAILAAGLPLGCRRPKPPLATRVWVGPTGGCAELFGPDKAIACWGANDAGQVGDGTTSPRLAGAAVPFGGGKVKELAIGPRHACAVLDGAVQCWGDGARGQLGDGRTASLVPAPTGDRGPGELRVAAGAAHTCVLSEAPAGRRLRCFGADDEGQLGAGWDSAELVTFTVGDAHTCAGYGREVSHVVCRGRREAAPPALFLVGGVVEQMSGGGAHTCAVLRDHTVRCWGSNDRGQLGDGTTTHSLTPVTPLDLRDVAAVAAGARHTCARLFNGTVTCWGDNEHHQLANGTTARSSRPGVIVGLVGVRELSVGGDGACARLDGGYLRCWGRNDRGQLGTGSTEELTVPMPNRLR
jgi:alpha-tubulin suppressor-like RCC1 family protein